MPEPSELASEICGLPSQGVEREMDSHIVTAEQCGPPVIGDSANTASIALHERLGFLRVGTLHAVGFKFGRWVDSVLMQRALIVDVVVPATADTQSGPSRRLGADPLVRE